VTKNYKKPSKPRSWRRAKDARRNIVARLAAICSRCGEPGPHFVPPSLGEEGFWACVRTSEEGEE
jgi:hypothetical protein